MSRKIFSNTETDADLIYPGFPDSRHHRLTLITHLQPDLQGLRREIDFIHNSLMPDTKNYHTWAYLNWLYSHFSKPPESQGGNRFTEESWAEEITWCNNMLDSDFKFRGPSAAALIDEAPPEVQGKIVPLDENTEEEGPVIGRGDGRNNSAWSWRWHLMIARKGAKPDPVVELEWVTRFATQVALSDPSVSQICPLTNSRHSAQRISLELPQRVSNGVYLSDRPAERIPCRRSAHKHFKIPLSQSLPAILPFTSIPVPSLVSAIPHNPPQLTTAANPDTPLPIPFALEWLADCESEQAVAGGNSSSYERAAGLYQELAERWDVMRKT